MKIDRTLYPDFFCDYILYISVTRSLSERTVNEYFLDIRFFLRYICWMKLDEFSNIDDIKEIDIKNMSVSVLNNLSIQDIYDFLYFLTDECGNHDKSRSRKISALKSFFKYLNYNVKLIENNPTERIELPSLKKSLPKYLTLDESKRLLSSIDTSNFERDYCIITLFLNCGIRLSELVGLNLSDINFLENSMRVLGKGNKERIVYLNLACQESMKKYLQVRNSEATDKSFFLSKRNTRISKRRVQQIVENALSTAGLDNRGFSTHKLRHTAATLMYQYGDVDALTLKDILGHASTSTTEIYTHLSDNILRNAMNQSPLANIESNKNSNEDK